MGRRTTTPHGASGSINAADYLQASLDHAASLTVLYTGRHYALTIYVSGLAAECLFRAFRARRGMPFRSDHPLESLAKEAGFPDLVSAGQRERFGEALSNLIVRWRNSHRFRSNAAARRFLKDLKLDRGITGDFLKENARILFSGATELINLGVVKWR
jgi:hypothetical protein